MRKFLSLILLSAAVIAQAFAGDPLAGTNPGVTKLAQGSERGRLLYENHCQVCHDSRAHIRSDHKAKTLEDIEGWVVRWSTELKLSWSADEIRDVARYLGKRYYNLSATP